jgi:hypothetical protein
VLLSLRWRKGGLIAALLAALLPPTAVLSQSSSRKTPSAPKSATSRPSPKFGPDDEMALVNGVKITRRELVRFWLQTDARAQAAVGALATERWIASGAFQLPEADLYARLFTDASLDFTNTLSNRVSNRLVEQEARRKSILVTQTQVKAYTKELFDREVRQKSGIQATDAQIMEQFKIPRLAFEEDVRFQLRLERLIADEIAQKLGHPIGPDDWIVVRELFAAAQTTPDGIPTEAQFAEARKRVEAWRAEVVAGKSLEEVARERNEGFTRSTGGLRNPSLRGTGTRSLEEAVWALKPGELSQPLRGRAGWYVFRVERRGDQIAREERERMWREILKAQKPIYVTELRRKAKIISVTPLPVSPPPTTSDWLLDSDNPNLPPPPPR